MSLIINKYSYRPPRPPDFELEDYNTYISFFNYRSSFLFLLVLFLHKQIKIILKGVEVQINSSKSYGHTVVFDQNEGSNLRITSYPWYILVKRSLILRLLGTQRLSPKKLLRTVYLVIFRRSFTRLENH